MLRLVTDDPIKRLYTAYLTARRDNPEFAESLREALEVARRSLPKARRPYDLKRRVGRALKRFEDVRHVETKGEPKAVTRLPARKVVRVFPGTPTKIGA